MSVCRLINGACRQLYRGEYKRFRSAGNIGHIQNEYLMSLLRRNAGTLYGKKYVFAEIDSYDKFRRSVPLTKYEDYEPYVGEIANGAENVLTAEKVLLFEPTSGSSNNARHRGKDIYRSGHTDRFRGRFRLFRQDRAVSYEQDLCG